MRRFLSISVVIVVVFVLSACSDNSTSSSTTITGASGGPVALDGTWLRACDAESTSVVTATISGSNATFVTDRFTELSCPGSAYAEESYAVAMTLGEETQAVLSGTLVTATRRDNDFTTDTITLFTQEAVDGFNTENSYGYSNWELGVAKSVLGRFFDGSTRALTYKQIWYADDTVTPQELYNGGGSYDQETEYPTELDPDPFLRQE